MYSKLLSKVFFGILVVVFLLIPSQKTEAHPLPNGVNHNTSLGIKDGHLHLNYALLMFYTDLDTLYAQIQQDKTKPVTHDEEKNWLEALKPKIYLESNSQKYIPQDISGFSNYMDIKDSIYPTVLFDIDFGEIKLGDTLTPFTLTNTYRIQSGDPQDWNFQFDSNTIYLENVKFPDKQTISGEWKDPKASSNNSNTSPNNNSVTATSNNNMNTNYVYDSARNFLDAAVRDPNLALPTMLTLIFVAILFGAAHTLTPGHGKSIIGAYMASIHGTWKDAVIMAASTTISHTGVVILLGLVFVFLRNGFQATLPLINVAINLPAFNLRLILPYLNVVSGIAIILIGLWIFRARLRDYINLKIKQQKHTHLHETGQTHIHEDSPSHQSHTSHEHQHDQKTHSHDHENHNHDHNHGPLGHTHDIPNRRLTIREAVTLGLSTGLSPCIDAIAILILAINLDKIWLGIGIILAFSVGMAGTLVIIGWTIGAGLKKSKRYKWGQNLMEWLPMISSGLIIIVGILLLIQTRG